MENQNPEEQQQGEESFLKPKVRAKRNITDEQRLILAERMRAINDKRIADAMAKKKDLETAKIEEPIKLKEKKPIHKVIKVVEVSEESESSSEDEVQYVVVPKKASMKKEPVKKSVKKAPAKKAKPQPVYESEEEDEAPKTILKPPRKQKASSQPQEPEAPKILYRFL